MDKQPKKSFAKYQQMLKSALNGITKYSHNSRRGFILIVEDNTGLHKFGTKNLVEKFTKTKNCIICEKDDTWEEVARLDTREMNSEDIGDVLEAAPKIGDNMDILASLYEANEVPKLPFAVDILTEKEAGAWLLPELKKDLVENGSKPVSRIGWGDEKFRPKCWAEDLAEWTTVSNISHPQKNKLKVPIVEVLKATIKNRLKQKNINPDDHVDSNLDKKKEKRKMMARGLHKAKKDLNDDDADAVVIDKGNNIPIDVVVVQDSESTESIGNSQNTTEDDQEPREVHDEEVMVNDMMDNSSEDEHFDVSFDREDGGMGR